MSLSRPLKNRAGMRQRLLIASSPEKGSMWKLFMIRENLFIVYEIFQHVTEYDLGRVSGFEFGLDTEEMTNGVHFRSSLA